MEQITFTITEEEIQQYAPKKLSNKEIIEILGTVELDESLWSAIEDAIQDAIRFVVKD